MKLSLRTKLMAVLVLAPVLLLLAAIGAIWTVDYQQRVAEKGGMFRGEAIQVARSLRLAVERSIGSLNELLSLGDVAGLLQSEEGEQVDSILGLLEGSHSTNRFAVVFLAARQPANSGCA